MVDVGTRPPPRVYPLGMPNQLVLAWVIDTSKTIFSAAQAAAALGAVPLYEDVTTDPVLGQFFGLTVASDVSAASGPTTATRTLTLNMTAALGTPTAPPPFPCHPITSTPPVLPYPLRSTRTLPGSFFVSTGSMSVPVSATQLPSLSVGDKIQFLSQQGVFYTIASTGVTSIGLTTPYTGVSGNTPAFKEVAAPVTLAAIYSTSDFDTAGVATTPAIPAGSGARTVTIAYKDSLGNLGSVTVSLTGRRPAAITLAGGTIDIAEIDNISIATSGGFGNSVGQITLASLSSALPPILANRTSDDFRGKLTDEGQLLIDRALAYLPQSYFAAAQQQAAAPQLEGDFILTTGSTSVQTTVDQTGVLSAGNVIQFAEQLANYTTLQTQAVFYVVADVTPKLIKLTTPFTGIDNNNTGTNQEGTNSNRATKGNLGTEVQSKRSGAFLITPSPAAPPSNDQLSAPLGQFVALETAAPPPNPPLSPATVPVPTFLSDLFTQTLQLALAGVPITPQQIAFA